MPSTPRGSPCSTTPSYPGRSSARVRDPRPPLVVVARVSVGVALATQDTVLSGAPGRHGREDISLPLPRSHGDATGLEGGARASTRA